jgi:hypothetical protein
VRHFFFITLPVASMIWLLNRIFFKYNSYNLALSNFLTNSKRHFECSILEKLKHFHCNTRKENSLTVMYSVEAAYGVDSVVSGLVAFVKDAETGRFLFLMVLILGCFTCS